MLTNATCCFVVAATHKEYSTISFENLYADALKTNVDFCTDKAQNSSADTFF
jgi:hypothetical protein